MIKGIVLFWSFVLVSGVILLYRVGQWAGGPMWYEKDAWLAFLFAVFIVYIILMVQAAEYLIAAFLFIGALLSVAVPSALAFYGAYYLASNVPTVKEIAILSMFIIIFSLTAGLIKQGQVDRRSRLPGD